MGVPASIVYDPVAHRFWRFRHDAPARLMHFETSPDRVVYTIRQSIPLGGPIGLLGAELSAGTSGKVSSPGQALFDNLQVLPREVNRANNVRLTEGALSVSEGAGSVTFRVRRAGDTSGETQVDFATEPADQRIPCTTVDGVARARCDFGTAAGTLRFAAGETEQTFTVFITDDSYVEGAERFRVRLGFPTSGIVETPQETVVTIIDNDAAGGATTNPVFTPEFLVRQQYLDFLSREPEAAGFQAWVRVLRGCAFEGNFGPGKSGSDPSCDRITVSSSFFRSAEFQLKGYFVIRYYRAALGRQPSYEEFLRDMTSVTGATAEQVTARREAFARSFIERSDVRALSETDTNAEYVARLATTAGVTLVNRAALVADLNAGRRTRSQVLREVVESEELFNREYNPAFVLMQYYGYLQRDPDAEGYNRWLTLLETTGDFRTMILGFLYSQEYQSRFGAP